MTEPPVGSRLASPGPSAGDMAGCRRAAPRPSQQGSGAAHSVRQHLQRERDVTAERREMRVAGDEERPRVTRGEREQQIVLQTCQADGLVVREYAWEQASGFEPA